jgi:hypothetical protein
LTGTSTARTISTGLLLSPLKTSPSDGDKLTSPSVLMSSDTCLMCLPCLPSVRWRRRRCHGSFVSSARAHTPQTFVSTGRNMILRPARSWLSALATAPPPFRCARHGRSAARAPRDRQLQTPQRPPAHWQAGGIGPARLRPQPRTHPSATGSVRSPMPPGQQRLSMVEASLSVSGSALPDTDSMCATIPASPG